jgi:hypothetical protein
MDHTRLPFHYAVMLTEDRVRSLRNERRLHAQMGQAQPLQKPRPEGRRRWSVAAFVGFLVPNRDAR